MMNILYVALGGALGSTLRYLLSKWVDDSTESVYPYGTFTVNIIGCLLIGILSALVSKSSLSIEMRLLLVTGFCGGFTTFSTFASESLSLMRTQDWLIFIAYVTLSLWLGIGAVWIGSKITQ